jgi:hypothetical protein
VALLGAAVKFRIGLEYVTVNTALVPDGAPGRLAVSV